jgi:nicotinate-nucleotide pyrophosphorylase (carboxylating)
MNLHYLTNQALNDFIELALAEDIGDGDHSSLAVLNHDLEQSAQLIIKGEGILAGVELAERILLFKNPKVELIRNSGDGDPVKNGDIAFTLSGNARKILSHERLVLNCMQRMSGIATYTSMLQSLISHTKAKVTDTRKTTPNFRLMEKWAVAIGGGVNHRMGLYDKILLKDNHIDYCGSMANALNKVKDYLEKTGKDLFVEVEARNLDEVTQALKFEIVSTIMLDNMPPSEIIRAVKIIDGKVKTEASGNITESTIKEVAECGVDYISVGALTHSYKSLDMSLKAF